MNAIARERFSIVKKEYLACMLELSDIVNQKGIVTLKPQDKQSQFTILQTKAKRNLFLRVFIGEF